MKRILIFVHRWLGVALCLLFLIWFPSGIAMMYWTYPDISPADRLERAAALDASTIRLSPLEAYAKLGLDTPPRAVSLNTFDGRPVYRFSGDGDFVVYADTGEEQLEVSDAMLKRIAEAWTKQPASAATIQQMTDVDQWTVQARFADVSPLWKFSWPNGEQLYVSQATGDVMQYTTTGSRLGAYVSAIPHWFYFTPLRKHGREWSRIVIWSSGIGTVAAILGMVVGVWMYSPSKRYRYDGAPSSIPYRGQKRWHTVFGLIFGLAAVTWAFSGMLSMDPFPRETGGGPLRRGGSGPTVREALRGRMQFASFAAKDPRQVLAQLGGVPVKELELTTFAGEPMYLASLGARETRLVPVSGEPQPAIDHQRIIDVVTSALGRDVVDMRVLDQYDRYYLDRRRERPLPVILAQLHDEQQTRYYIDPKTARVVGGYNSSNWMSRWLYNGLHSLNFPWLYNYRPLWDIVVITFMAGGTALCVTSLVLAWRVLGRKLRSVVPGSPPQSRVSDNLAVAD
jgi:hypothetical protein